MRHARRWGVLVGLAAAAVLAGCRGDDTRAQSPSTAPQPATARLTKKPPPESAETGILLKMNASGKCSADASPVSARKKYFAVWDVYNTCDSRDHTIEIDPRGEYGHLDQTTGEFVKDSDADIPLKCVPKSLGSKAGDRFRCWVLAKTGTEDVKPGWYRYTIRVDGVANDPELEIQN